jgi:DMSO/TMAO reductase YedYZ molybdopterin-dependent catalytic subunit
MAEQRRGPGAAERLAEALRRAAANVAERPEATSEQPRGRLAAHSRRTFLLFGAGALATATTGWWLLPERTKRSWLPALHDPLDTLAVRVGLTRAQRERTLNRVLTFDDDVAEALASGDHRVRTYARADATPLRNNYHGRTPGPEYLAGWRLNLSGLASGRSESLAIGELTRSFERHDMNTRLVCVEGWSAVAAWGGLRFADLLAAFPPAPEMRWAALESAVSLNGAGAPERYYVSLDLGTARHPQALLATHHAGAPLTLAHGAPLRLVVPMKLGLKNIKAITHIEYTADEPADYWNERGYSKYDGL